MENSIYPKDPKFSDKPVWENSADSDQTAPRGAEEQSDEGLHCLLFHLHHLKVLHHGRTF